MTGSLKVGLIDYGAGNLRSVQNAFRALNVSTQIVSSQEDIQQIQSLVLPGVGHFRSMMDALSRADLIPAIHQWVESERPFLGICLGFQSLFASSEEAPGVPGFGFWSENVQKLSSDGPVPHIGWARVKPAENVGSHRLDGHFSFANSYAAPAVQDTVALFDHQTVYTAAVQRGLLWGCQFHPEKSGDAGLDYLKAFIREAK